MSQETVGFHNANLEGVTTERLIHGHSYRDLSTICIVPSRDFKLDSRFDAAFERLIRPMNNKFIRLRLDGLEVADAFNTALRVIFENPDLSKWRFLLTLEDDNLPPPDGLLKLQAAMCETQYAAIGGLYWTKGEGGQPMIYGNPGEVPINFRPQVPIPNAIQECRGIAHGFTLWDLSLFKDPRLPLSPGVWFKTWQHYDATTGGIRAGTQDLEFCERAQKLGYRFAIHTGVLVGHLDKQTGMVW
jgi:hypothetical protein